MVDADDGVRGPRDVALGGGRVLWAEETAERIGSAGPDGSDVQGFAAPGVRGVAFDPRPLAPAVPLWPWAPER